MFDRKIRIFMAVVEEGEFLGGWEKDLYVTISSIATACTVRRRIRHLAFQS